LIDVIEASGATMESVKAMQRVDTVGGTPPADKADVQNLGQEKQIEYSATYKFYAAKRLCCRGFDLAPSLPFCSARLI